MAASTHWAEMYGGPFDGRMVELLWRFIEGTENIGIAISETETPLGDDLVSARPPPRHYKPAYRADPS